MGKIVNCRIGSLENPAASLIRFLNVNCRIGSLEISRYMEAGVEKVNCRIGSLENIVRWIINSKRS